MAVNQYVTHLYSKELDGYVQILQLRDGQAIKVLNTDIKGLVEVVKQQQGQADTYITPNTFYIPLRANENIRQFRALYIDLDLSIHTKTTAFYEIYLKSARGEIPKPSMIVDSGRGLHCYWRIEHAPKGAAYTWQELQDYLYRQLKDLGADIKATDAARVMRLPSTVNSKNGGVCEVLEDNDVEYSMYDLRKKFLNYERKMDKPTKPKGSNKAKIKPLFNSYSLHHARFQDLETLAKLRGFRLTGYRNTFIHLYSYWQGICIRNDDALYEVVDRFNRKFAAPLKDTEVRGAVRGATKAIGKFIDYEQGIRSGQDKRVSKGMRERGGYWYSNKKLIELLDITEQEQQHLKTIISTKEKRRRDSLKKYNARRNEAGLTSRQQHKQDITGKIAELRSKGLTVEAISKEVGLTIKGVEYHLYY